MALVADASRRPPSVYQVSSSKALAFGRYGARCVSALMGLVTLTFELLILKLVCESHLRSGTFLPSFLPLGSQIIHYVRDGWTDGRTKATLTAPFPIRAA